MWVSLASSSSSSMEVNAIQVNNDKVNGIAEQSLSPEFSNGYDVFGDPEISPRVGEEFQVDIPPLISQYEYCSIQRNIGEAESTVTTLHNFQVGLPVPIFWIKNGTENNNCDPLKNECIEESQIGMHEEHRHKGQILVPGSPSESWTEIEEAGFALGVYIFGKNLVQVKRFISNKKMGDILSFYYGRFYKSDKHQRWAGSRKVRSRKYIFGQKIFTGPRQQELMSRLLPNVSEECQKKLPEVSKKFIEGKMLLEDYVLTLKALVGLKALVEGVGIGKGKQDLTSLSVDSVKSTQANTARPEIPMGKACSMLTCSEIISFLTGDFRLSKARTSDLFWEAVWPRLLARGWHSEQPGSYNYAVAFKNPLVFLVPGVKKFSRKLVKGSHYFDSVSDVLGKVASDPELIDLETNADNNDCASKEGNEWTKDTKQDRENSPDQPRHCYLKAKTPNRSTDVMKFTVVDTSLASENAKNVRELRNLPFGVLTASTMETDSDDETSSEEQTNESESLNGTCFDSENNDITKAGKFFNIVKSASSDMNGLENKPSKDELPRSNMLCTSLPYALVDKKTAFSDNKRRRDGTKCQSLQKMVSDNIKDLLPITKRRKRLTPCSRAKKNDNAANFFEVPRVKQEEVGFCLDPDNSKFGENVTVDKASYCPYNPKSSDSVHSRVSPPQENNSLADFPTQKMKSLSDPLSNPSSTICREDVPDTSSSGTKDQQQKPQPWTMIDLNLLPVSPEVDDDELFANEVTEIPKTDTSKESVELGVETNVKPVDDSDQQPDLQARRQSTRNRPPTTKVLEAFAFGYLDKKEKRSRSRDSSVSKNSRRVCPKVEGTGSGVAGSENEERANIVCNSNGSGSSSSNGNVLYTDFKL
ncbi:uncharacterized protein [Cicer arietinum]|uniref:Uncharacterized protein LOC101496029 n=1 Tax=Cicer arietinum TaxID=3827 RepID=A0A1S2YQE0_CICAR|nr:uncharacterized protein LOC101496029 [Cicer arietinum]